MPSVSLLRVAVLGSASPAWVAALEDQGARQGWSDLVQCIALTADTPQWQAQARACHGLLLTASPTETLPLRTALHTEGLAYQVLHGTPATQLQPAINALGLWARAHLPSLQARRLPIEDPGTPQRLRAWSCEKCSDPQCEHLLFSALMSDRAAASAS